MAGGWRKTGMMVVPVGVRGFMVMGGVHGSIGWLCAAVGGAGVK